MEFFRLNQEHQIERKKPLESLAPGFEFDLDIRSPIVSNPDPKVVSIRTVANLVTPLLPTTPRISW